MGDDRTGREGRFRDLFDTHKAAVRAYAWRRSPQATEDIVAETFAMAWQHLDEVPDDPRPWLLRVARNVLLNGARSERRRRERESRWAAPDYEPSFTGDIEGRSELRAALQQLPERDREILLLAAWERLDRASLATVLGCSKTAAGVRLHRARRRLEAALGDAAVSSRPVTTTSDGRLLDEC